MPPGEASAPDAPAPRTDPDDALAGVRVALIQARDTDEMEAQEQTCFAERCRLRPEQFRCVNLAASPLPGDFLDGADALMIGGAGAYSALDDPAWMAGLLDRVREAAERRLPTFGSCWGHQVLARALGGELTHDSARAELGCVPIQLTEAGQRDPLFGRTCPERFEANAGHHDRVTALPPGAVELAFNDSQRFQAFRMKEAPMYGTQFHSELSAERERERLIAYRDYYRKDMPDEDEFQATLNGLVDTGAADALLYDFLCRFVAAS